MTNYTAEQIKQLADALRACAGALQAVCRSGRASEKDAITINGMRKTISDILDDADDALAAPEPPASGTGFVKLCIYERRHGTFATLGSRVLFGAVISPTGQPTRTYRIPLDDLREIIDHAVRTGDQE